MIRIELWIAGELKVERFVSSTSSVKNCIDRLKEKYKYVLCRTNWQVYVIRASKMNDRRFVVQNWDKTPSEKVEKRYEMLLKKSA